MRSAEEILNKYDDSSEDIFYGDVIKAINEARKEAINECADEAYSIASKGAHAKGIKQSILDLIKELK